MSVTLQSLVDQAVAIGHVMQELDPELQVEALAQRTIDEVIDEMGAEGPESRALTLATVSLSLVNGNAAFPVQARIHLLRHASVSDPLDATLAKKMKWVELWSDIIRPLPSTGIGYFIARGTTFFMSKPGTAFSTTSGYTGTINVDMPCSPQVPALHTDPITIAPEVEKRVVLRLADRLRAAVKV